MRHVRVNKERMHTKSQSRVVIVGGGFGGVFTAFELAGEADLTLISRSENFTSTPLLYEYLGGEVEAWHIAPSYRDLLDGNVHLGHGDVVEVDFD